MKRITLSVTNEQHDQLIRSFKSTTEIRKAAIKLLMVEAAWMSDDWQQVEQGKPLRDDVSGRYVRDGDMGDVMAIEDTTPEPWTIGRWDKHRRQTNVEAFVAVVNELTVGAVLYELHKDKLNLLRVVVDKSHRRTGIGTTIIHYMKKKLGGKRTRMEAFVSESDVPSQLFLRSCGFVAMQDGNGLLFTYRQSSRKEA